jgi:alanine racemase
LNYSSHTIASILKSKLDSGQELSISYLLIDSRQLIFPAKTIFFALPGLHTDGHNFIKELYKKGVRCFVVSQNFKSENFPEAQFLKVENILIALQNLAAYHRSQFQLPVLGITGSNGKTVVKEMLYQLLHSQFKIVKSPKSYNSQLGVPLSLWQISEGDELGIFEAGISKAGEMDRLQKMIQPTIGLFTYLGKAHAAGFISEDEKVKEKLELFKHSKLLIYNSDDNILQKAILAFKEKENKSIELFSWGKEAADVNITYIKSINNSTKIEYIFKGETNEFEIPFVDEASVHNALSCLAVLLYLNISAACALPK